MLTGLLPIWQDLSLKVLSIALEYLQKPHPMKEFIYMGTKHWQGIPNCQDPISKSMIDFLLNGIIGMDLHCLINAITDFAIMGVQTSWRAIERSQPMCPKKAKGIYLYDKPTSKFKNKSYTCYIKDFTFKFNRGTFVTNILDTPIRKIKTCGIRWRFQK